MSVHLSVLIAVVVKWKHLPNKVGVPTYLGVGDSLGVQKKALLSSLRDI